MADLSTDYKGQLITYCARQKMTYAFQKVSVTGPSHNPMFTYHVFINGEKLGEGEDNTKKKAESIAAKMALEALQNQENLNLPAGRPQLPETPPPAVSNIPASSSSSPAESENLGYYISQINMYAQERKIKCEFVFTSTSGVDHLPVFTFRCIIGDRTFKEGTGQNKLIAKGIAAKLAWEEIVSEENCGGRPQLPETPPPAVSKIPAAAASPAESGNLGYYISQINTYAQQRKIKCEFVFTSTSGVDHLPVFTFRCIIGNRTFKEGTGQNKQIAKGIAAKLAWEEIESEENCVAQRASETSPLVPVSALPCSPSAAESLVSNDGAEREKQKVDQLNYIGILNEFCQKKGWMRRGFEEVDRSGPPHVPRFVSRATIEGQMFPEATGKNKKAAENMAAFLALKELNAKYPDCIQLTQILSTARDTLEESGSENSSVSESSLPGFDDITYLDSGGYGTVYKARKILDNKYYVVKQVKLQNKKSIAEVQTLARLKHENIVQYYHSWTTVDNSSESSSNSSEENGVKGKFIFIQMEYCSLGTLRSWIDKMEMVDRNKSLEIFRQIIEGVVYIHSQQLIHRDLKPLNIFFAEEWKIKIGDFGLVTAMTGEHEEQEVLRTQCIGTQSYMAPEQEKNNIY
ncbi:interferon-induced, double-stranded RNA-activated protein kinase-like isoform X2 [Ascaphus truei]|uniref:interferon-induced, double-stranded RNA-activated protein kinase-like isoform X2 n=1 Tax=Ascaphus truei TaxID=8439 RepID=UPI003F596BF2